MEKVYSKGYNGWSQLAILLSLAGGGIVLGSLVSIPIWKAMTHGSLLNMQKDMLNPANAAALQAIQAVSVLFMFFLPTIVFAFICYRNGWGYLGFTSKIQPKQILIVLLLIFCSLPLISFLEELNKMIPLTASLRARFENMEKKYTEQVEVMAQVRTWGEYFSALLIIAILPAVTEEMLFRGGMQNMFTRWFRSPWAALILTSFIFSAFHFSWFGFLPRFALGMVLGLIFLYTGNIWLNILMHFINNALVITIMFLDKRNMGKAGATAVSQESYPIWAGLLGLVLVILLLRWLIKISPPLTFEEENVALNTRNPFGDQAGN